jgi:hypothetical protein
MLLSRKVGLFIKKVVVNALVFSTRPTKSIFALPVLLDDPTLVDICPGAAKDKHGIRNKINARIRNKPPHPSLFSDFSTRSRVRVDREYLGHSNPSSIG